MASWGLGSSGAQPWRRRGCQRPAEKPTDEIPPRGLERSPPALGWRAGSFLAPSLLPPQRASVQLGGCSCTARPQEMVSVAAPGSTGGHSRGVDPQVLSLRSGWLSGLGPVVSLITVPAFPVPPGRWAASTLLLLRLSEATPLTDPCVY